MDKTMVWCGINLQWAYTDLLGYIRFKVACPHIAKDILHDALIRYTVSTSANKGDEPHAYMRSIAKNLIVDSYHQAQRFVSLDADNGLHREWLDTPTLSVDQLNDIKQRLEMIQLILEQLPTRCRQVFWMYRVEGYTQTEIAAALGISKNMVERHVMRAIVDLSSARELIVSEI
ncbi:RNA polymerase sigma factor [Methylophilus sp. 5]|uniref:RNA polymerase sigma factor n=1 Tax=Methylophilus sp. 5 TaxID=1112274 RepID=UPI0004903B57|nr:sigma-70 family RNA polymerase sigma factor [Methylophilus sp. 5]